MKKILVLLLIIAGGMSTTFGQLQIANNYGKDLKISVNGDSKTVAFKAVKTFNFRGLNVNIDCAELNSAVKFSVSKQVSRRGYVSIEPSDYQPVVQTQTTTYTQSYVQPTATPQGNYKTGDLDAILTKPGYRTTTTTTNTGAPVVQNNVTVQQYYAPPQPQVQNTFNVWVENKTDQSFKVFSDIGGKQWQGIEFSSAKNSDSTNSSNKSRYLLPVVVGDMHMGVIFPPEGAINTYGELRKRVNAGITSFGIYNGDITKMSTDKQKPIRVRFMALGYELYFEPKSETQGGNNDPVSIKYKQTSRRFMAPIGQFYLKVSVTDPKGMFHPTVFIPMHVTSTDGVFDITTKDVVKAINADINLNWSNLSQINGGQN